MGGPLNERFELRRFETTVAPAGDTGHGWRAPMGRRLNAVVRHAAALVRFVALLLCWRPALVHIHTCSYNTFWRNLVDAGVARLLGRRVLWHMRGGQFARFHASRKRPGRWLIEQGLGRSDGVIALSEGWREQLRPCTGGARVFVVPNAYDPVLVDAVRYWRERRHDDAAHCRFLFLGPLTEAKGLGDLLNAAARLRAERVPLRLLVAGPATAAERAAWWQRVRRAGLAGCVRLLPAVRGAAKAKLLAWADVLVHPSHSEGLPLTVLEAAACDVPVIATAVGAVPELLGPMGGPSGGPLVPPHEPALLAAEMAACVRAPYRRRAAGFALGAHVRRHYDVASVARQVGAVYAQVLGLAAAVGVATTARAAVAVGAGKSSQPERAGNTTSVPLLSSCSAHSA